MDVLYLVKSRVGESLEHKLLIPSPQYKSKHFNGIPLFYHAECIKENDTIPKSTKFWDKTIHASLIFCFWFVIYTGWSHSETTPI